jgi:hypothetical protein
MPCTSNILSQSSSSVTCEGGFLDWLLGLFDTHLLQFSVTIDSGALANSHLQFIAPLLFHTVCSSLHALNPIDLLSHTSLLVPASKGRRSLSWVPELSPSHSHNDSWLTVHSLNPGTVSSCLELCRLELSQYLLLFGLELYPVTGFCLSSSGYFATDGPRYRPTAFQKIW